MPVGMAEGHGGYVSACELCTFYEVRAIPLDPL